ncbi:hypothetical protein F4809DRAFT_658451 [Biscogniauxia mediterranea]|nr:hypothetical protein F4809DRAFT_658451 [Biscogniauxia mediterranea]
MSERIGKAGLALLRSQVRIRTTDNDESKYHSVDVDRGDACRITIHATKPFPDPLLLPSPAAGAGVNPRDYVEVAHSSCRCPAFARTPEALFPAWRRVADALRYGEGQPEIWPAFACEGGDGDGDSYAAAEALAAAALVAKMGLRTAEWPECFDGLAEELGAKRKEGEEEEEEEWGEDWQDEDEGLEEGEWVGDGDHQDRNPAERAAESLNWLDAWSAMAAGNAEW